jgi:tetratricopeptide (TPR) repeat protein
MKYAHPAALLSLALAACASTEPEPAFEPAYQQPYGVATEASAPAPAEVEAGAESAAPAAPAPKDSVASFDRPSPWRMSEGELAIWSDPRFKRHFVESYQSETEVEPTVTVVERDVMQDVLDFMSSDQQERAVALLEKSRGRAGSAVFDFTLANIYFQQESLEEASEAYQVAVDKFPKFRRAWKNLGLIHVRQEDWEKAAKAFTRVVELGGSDAITFGLLGYSYSNMEKDLEAEAAYRMAILLDPVTMDWKMGLARSLFKLKRYADAVALCDSLIGDHPDRPELWLLQANAFIGLGQPLRAAENYELVDRLGGSTPQTLNMLGDIYINEEIYEMALDSYVRAMEMNPEGSPDRALRAAQVFIARGALDETRTLVDRIESVYATALSDDDRVAVLKLRARLAVAEGAGEEEVKVLEQIVELDPLDGEALLLLGRHSDRNGDSEQAIFYYERAASLEAFEADAKVAHAQLLVRQGKYRDAIPMLERAQMLEPRENVQEYLEQVERAAKSR